MMEITIYTRDGKVAAFCQLCGDDVVITPRIGIRELRELYLAHMRKEHGNE